MSFTKVPKPTSTAYTNLNPNGKEQYDQADITYDSANVFYDGINNNMYTDVAKPTSTSWTKVAKPT